ncbi:MAG: replicative DNA helicase [Chloroflexi bacterium]|nr:replicative DNA helicase [Chloroflexota bacterium]
MAIDDLVPESAPLVAPPYDVEQEEAILGSVLLDPESLGLIAHTLKQEHFYRERNGELFAAMMALYDRRAKIDVLTVCDELGQRGSLDRVGGQQYIWTLYGAVPTSLHVEQYAENVVRMEFMRRLITAGQEIVRLGYRDAESSQRTLERAERLLLDAASGQGSRDFSSLADILSEYMDSLAALEGDEDRLRFGLPTGFIDLDKLLGGLQRGNLVILAARPAMGKTSLALNVAAQAAIKSRARVAMFSLEMSKHELAARLLSTESGVDSTRLRGGHLNQTELARLSNALATLSETEFYIDDTAGIAISELRFKAKRLASFTNVDLIVLDYLQLVQGTKSDNRVQEISEISRSLKNLALELHLPVLALSQLSRAVESRTPRIPQLSDLRESGSIEQDADVVLFIYRDDYYNKDSEQKGIAEIHVAKHRNGPTGEVRLLFNDRNTRFLNLQADRE